MLEYVDICDVRGNFTGVVKEKHEPILPGEYRRHAIVVLKTREGKYVLQQRSLRARYFPGAWDATGGAVASGETGAQAARREALEELGVSVDIADMRLIYTELQDWGNDTGLIVETYAARVDVPQGGFTLAEMEVNDVRLVDYAEFEEAVMHNKTEGFRAALRRIEAEI